MSACVYTQLVCEYVSVCLCMHSGVYSIFVCVLSGTTTGHVHVWALGMQACKWRSVCHVLKTTPTSFRNDAICSYRRTEHIVLL